MLHAKVLRNCADGYKIDASCGLRTNKIIWDGGPTCHCFRKKANRKLGYKDGYIKLEKPNQIASMSQFIHTIETFIVRRKKRITLVDFLLQHEEGNGNDCKWHQDMVTHGLGIIVNIGVNIE